MTEKTGESGQGFPPFSQKSKKALTFAICGAKVGPSSTEGFAMKLVRFSFAYRYYRYFNRK